MKIDARIPHFLRVTQALAFVSGFGLPMTAGCGGAFSPSAGTESDSGGSDGAYAGDSPVGQPEPGSGGVSVPPPAPPSEGGAPGPADSGRVSPFDGAVTGVVIHRDASVPYDGGPAGVGVYDGAVTGVIAYPDATVAYDGGPTGVAVYDGGPLGIIAPLDGGIVVGGPLVAPELPA